MEKSFTALYFDGEPTDDFKHNYSRFKYGSKKATKEFANILIKKFIKTEFFKHIIDNHIEVLLIPSSYFYVPTASSFLVKYFHKKLNIQLALNNCKPADLGRIHRKYTYEQDYAMMSAEERETNINNDMYQCDYSQWDNKFVIVVDDVKITGAHERRALELIKSAPGEIEFNYLFMYLAHVEGLNDPTVENRINTHAMHGLKSIDYIIKNHGILINTRVLKYILTRPNTEFYEFIKYQSEEILNQLLVASFGNLYHNKVEYASNVKMLQQYISLTYSTPRPKFKPA